MVKCVIILKDKKNLIFKAVESNYRNFLKEGYDGYGDQYEKG